MKKIKASEDLFPSKLALGRVFCNRVKERSLLSDNILKSRHTVLVSPRRYGKSSLVHYVINELKYPAAAIDLFLAHDDKAIVKRLLAGIALAIGQMISVEQKKLDKIKAIFNRFHVSINFGVFQLEMQSSLGEVDAVDQIYSALKSLDALAQKQKKKVIVFIDEFQDIAIAQSSKSIQGAIRHVAQETSYLTFIFSGSNRHLLLELFDDKSMPLYMLCDKMYLDRIHSKDYTAHLQNLAIQKWGQKLSQMTLSKIFTLTELHPFYINLLCHKVWLGNYPESALEIEQYWIGCMNDESRRIRAELEKLSRKQQDVLKALSVYPTTTPTSSEFSIQSGIAVSSLHQAIKTLFAGDMIFKVTQIDSNIPALKYNQVRVLDPLISYYLKQFL